MILDDGLSLNSLILIRHENTQQNRAAINVESHLLTNSSSQDQPQFQDSPAVTTLSNSSSSAAKQTIVQHEINLQMLNTTDRTDEPSANYARRKPVTIRC